MAVTTTMVVTTIMLFRVAAYALALAVWPRVALTGFFWSSIWLSGAPTWSRFRQGGWFPLLIGVAVLVLMTTWRQGRSLLAQQLRAGTRRFSDFVEHLDFETLVRVPGAAVFMYSDPDGTPPALIKNLRHNKVLHEQVVLLSINTVEVPRVPVTHRMTVHDLGHGFYRVVLYYGFMETSNVHARPGAGARSWIDARSG
jgi:KUP system potassium uptake protein